MVYKTAPRHKIVSVYTVGNLVYYFPKTFPVFLRLFPHEQKSGTEYSVGYRDYIHYRHPVKTAKYTNYSKYTITRPTPHSRRSYLF